VTQNKWPAVLVVAASVAAALLFYWKCMGTPANESAAEQPELPAERELPAPPQASMDEPRPTAPTLPPASASAAPVPTATIAPDNGRPPCTSDQECKGPRHAACIDIKCVQGKCVYDESHCECVNNDDCDDGNPCTRNHCFSSTQKCIYIPIDDCK
jgi:hypothetical protein